MNMILRAWGAVLLSTLFVTVLALGCEATKQRPPKQAQDAPLQSSKYGDQNVVLEPAADAGDTSTTK
jgi:hypothetical protein